MARLPALSGKDVVKALKKAGFDETRITGSHHRMKSPDQPVRYVTVAIQGNRTLKRKTISSILKQAGLSDEEFIDLL